jgi:hypothetical protein
MRPSRTNPEYAAMAYRRAIIGNCIAHLMTLTSSMGEEPKGKIISEDVVREDSVVPEDEINDYIFELKQEHESLQLEMAKFEFVKREDDDKKRNGKKQAEAAEEAPARGKRRKQPAAGDAG